MGYSAQILSIQLKNGMIVITIQYTSSDNTDVFTETISTLTAQDDGWLDKQITDRLNTLNSLWDYNTAIQTDPMMNNTLSIDSTQLAIKSTPISSIATPQETLGTVL